MNDIYHYDEGDSLGKTFSFWMNSLIESENSGFHFQFDSFSEKKWRYR
jgi:hypothetical protein